MANTLLSTVVEAATSDGLTGSYALVDLETTGGSAGFDRIIEVGIVLYDNGQVVEEWSTLVNPGRYIPVQVQSFTGITEAMVESAPVFAAVAGEVLRRLEGRIFVAHNARFDYGFLRAEFKRLGQRFRAPVLCTVKLSRRIHPEEPRHNLDAVMERHGLSCAARHRALGDARVLAGLLSSLRQSVDAEQLRTTVEILTETPSLPATVDPELVDDLPDSPGVYRMYSHDTLLYVGSAANLRSKVLGHFANRASERDRKLADEVRRIDWVETAGELGAALAELKTLRESAPSHMNPHDKVLWSIALDDAGGWLQPRITEFDAAEPLRFGAFRRERDGNKALEQIVKAHRLCRKMLGLEQAEGSCVGHQLGHCRGACVGKESSILHNARIQLALSGLKLKEALPRPSRGARAFVDRVG